VFFPEARVCSEHEPAKPLFGNAWLISLGKTGYGGTDRLMATILDF
jgi:hypothetical protein